MATLGEVLSLATHRGAIMGKIWLLLVFRLLENAFATIADFKMLSDIDGHSKPQPLSIQKDTPWCMKSMLNSNLS